MKVPAVWVSPTASLLGLQLAIFSLSLYMVLPQCVSMSKFSLLIRTPIIMG